MPLDGETFHEWIERVGRSVEDTAFYWKQIAVDNLELGMDGMDDRDAEIADLRAKLASAETARDAAIAPFIAIAKSVIDNRHRLPWYSGDNPVAFSMGGVNVTFEDCSRLLTAMAKEYARRANG